MSHGPPQNLIDLVHLDSPPLNLRVTSLDGNYFGLSSVEAHRITTFLRIRHAVVEILSPMIHCAVPMSHIHQMFSNVVEMDDSLQSMVNVKPSNVAVQCYQVDSRPKGCHYRRLKS